MYEASVDPHSLTEPDKRISQHPAPQTTKFRESGVIFVN